MAPTRSPHAGRLIGALVRGLVAGGNSPSAAAAYLAGQTSPEAAEAARVLRAAVGAHTAADLADATKPVGLDLGELVRGLSVVGRLPNVRRVPFRTRLVEQVAGAVAEFVQPGAAAPAYGLAFGAADGLEPAKIAVISAVSQELLRAAPEVSDPIIANDLAAACALGADARFADFTVAPTAEEPGGIGYGSEILVASGATVAAIDFDLRRMLTAITTAGYSLRSAAWVCHARTAAFMATQRSGDNFAWPGVRADGGVLFGLPLLASTAVPLMASPAASAITLVVGDQVRLADDGQAEIETSRLATLQMSDTPTQNGITPTASTGVSMFQNSTIAVLARRWISWRLAHADAAVVLAGVTF